MAKQKRRLEVATGQSGVSNNFIDMTFINDASVNLHGLRVGVAIEPENADANANGMICVWDLPNDLIQNTDLPLNFGAFGDEDHSQYIWGWIPWVASNQTPFHWEFAPNTTRNKARDSRIVVQILIAGISAGLARHNTSITGFVTPT